MKHKLEHILKDITSLDPELKGGKTEELVRRLLQYKPHAAMDKRFKKRLRARLFEQKPSVLRNVTENETGAGFFTWFKTQRLRLAAAASVFSLLLIAAIVFLPLMTTFQQNNMIVTDRGLVIKENKPETAATVPEPGRADEQAKDEKEKKDTGVSPIQRQPSSASPQTETVNTGKPEKTDKAVLLPETRSTAKTTDTNKPRELKLAEKKTETKEAEELLEQTNKPYDELKAPKGAPGAEGAVPLAQKSDQPLAGILGDTDVTAKDKTERSKIIPFDTEEYDRIYENDFLTALQNPLSTFSIDVDTASYANVRRYLNKGMLPPPDAVRIEELVNYFSYDYPEPRGENPFSFTTETAACPWNPDHKLLFIGIRGASLNLGSAPPSNLVFLLDVSGSMDEPDKLPLLKQAIGLLVDNLRPQDRVSIVVYAGAAGLVLPPTGIAQKQKIVTALNRLSAGGSTAGGRGIELAYKTAEENFMPQGNNRIILATDGDFNVGVSSDAGLVRLIEENRNQGIFLTVLGFGSGNYKDSKMEKLADTGNGNYAYIDSLMEAKKVLVSEMSGTLYTIAKDVKVQAEFNPARVKAYRLLGYENRLLQSRDFADDSRDAGELGAGHTLTVFYEIIPEHEPVPAEQLKYQSTTVDKNAYTSPELMTLRFRYKKPLEDTSRLIEVAVNDDNVSYEKASVNFRFAAAVAEWGLLLKNSRYKAEAGYAQVLALAGNALGTDPEGRRAEFIRLVKIAQQLSSTK